MRSAAVILTILVFQGVAKGQTTVDSIKHTVNTLFTAMRNGDSVLLKSCFSAQSFLQTITNVSGQTKVRNESVNDFARAIGTPHKEVYDERITFGTILIDGDLASVWTPYKFYLGATFIHCGVNSFQLVRYGEGWKIQYLIDTRRKQPCE